MSDTFHPDQLAALYNARPVDGRIDYVYNGTTTQPIPVQGLLSLTDEQLRDPKTRRTAIMGNHPVTGARLSADEHAEYIGKLDAAKKLSESEHTLALLFVEVIEGTAAVNEGRATQDIVDAMVNDRLELMRTMRHA